MSNNDNNGHYEGALLEEIRDNVKQLAESMSGVGDKVDAMDSRLAQVEQNTDVLPAIQSAVTDQNNELDDHEHRITNLEKTAA